MKMIASVESCLQRDSFLIVKCKYI